MGGEGRLIFGNIDRLDGDISCRISLWARRALEEGGFGVEACIYVQLTLFCI